MNSVYYIIIILLFLLVPNISSSQLYNDPQDLSINMSQRTEVHNLNKFQEIGKQSGTFHMEINKLESKATNNSDYFTI